MASPVSIGDAYLMARLAFKIGQAFTKGRKSAPAELGEVEKPALLVDPSRLPKNAPPHYKDNQVIILGMLGSCRDTLSHLQSIVEEYGIIGTASDPEQARLKRWSRRLKVNWKKIEWTTKGGDLAALKSDLTFQTNSLNLILGVVATTQTDRLRNDVDKVSVMLTEIHEWFVDNLKNTTASATPLTVSSPNETVKPPSDNLFFQLFAQSGQNSTFICPQASLGQKISGAYYSKSLESSQLFSCHCPDSSPNSVNHQSSVELYELSPLSFAVRIAGNKRSWLLYKIANRVTNQLITLVVKGVSPDAMHDFEELLVHGLSVMQTRQMLLQNTGTMLAYASELEASSPKANILDIISNAAMGHQSIITVKFISNNGYFLRESIKYIQMLHYKTINLERILGDAVLPRSAFEESKTADILIAYGEGKKTNNAADDIVRTVLGLRWNSEVKYQSEGETVSVKTVDCTSFNANDNPRNTISATVEFQLAYSDAASQFYTEMEAIRMDLFVIHLQHPRDEERTVLKLQAQSAHTERVHISDADITILQDTTTFRFRLVVQSRNRCSIISQELKEDIFDKATDRGNPDYKTLSYEVFMDESGKRRVQKCPNGFRHLILTNSKIDKVFALGLRAVAGSAPPRIAGGSDAMEGVLSG
ncbi:hypothetical protein B0J13DRAFT_676394 [Dactylonectria estremocensis]|uniref:Uncharacterized protein n=1 Tax=Dactylonectria estremocensis TaxID=1079267 RepID=A0A9P9EP92_9HYPO|nr:hypothetical protein B0J13DRAFT_676394 [Dactylonectria estremocensis]